MKKLAICGICRRSPPGDKASYLEDVMAFLSPAVFAAFSLGLSFSDIKVGDCLGVDQLKSLVRIDQLDNYLPGECRTRYPLEGSLTQKLTCGLEMQTGNWTRSMAEHTKPGIFFPPCIQGVTALSYMNYKIKDQVDENACSEDLAEAIELQREEMKTQYYQIAQGGAYLPHPLKIESVSYKMDPKEGYMVSSCQDTDIQLDYLGWGAMQAKVQLTNCLTNDKPFCRIAKLELSTDKEGRDCGLIKKLNDCN